MRPSSENFSSPVTSLLPFPIHNGTTDNHTEVKVHGTISRLLYMVLGLGEGLTHNHRSCNGLTNFPIHHGHSLGVGAGSGLDLPWAVKCLLTEVGTRWGEDVFCRSSLGLAGTPDSCYLCPFKKFLSQWEISPGLLPTRSHKAMVS